MRIINLLPKPRQQELRYAALLHSLWQAVGWSFFGFILVFLAQFGAKFYLQLQNQLIASQITQLQQQVNKQENAQLKAQVKAANDIISDYSNLAAAAPNWSRVIKAFAPLPPPGVKINNFGINTSAKSINISGIAPTRELVILLYNNILADKADFYNIDYPLENIAQPVNNNFHFTFYIQDRLLKPQ